MFGGNREWGNAGERVYTSDRVKSIEERIEEEIKDIKKDVLLIKEILIKQIEGK